jgi:CRP-like cAMP-binding protein
MNSIRDVCKGLPETLFGTDRTLIVEGEETGRLYVLIEGEVAIVRGKTEVVAVSEPGAVFGEMSILLGKPHSATVVARRPCRVFVIEDGRAFMRSHPDVLLQISRLLALRLHMMTGYLADLKTQYFDRHDHLSMVEEVLGCLCQHHDHEFTMGSDRVPHPEA